nr:MAG: RNA-dependent RNA polymerase [Porcine picobirnavirus]UAW00418.1 MAG: RNA-dependent RNA polymerase [Porcine picobirnavirus]
MKETKLTSEQAQIVQSNNGLKMYLSGLSTGHAATPRSNLYNLEGKTQVLSPDEILAQWTRRLHRLSNGDSFERKVFQFDTSQIEKWGPQGEVPPIDDIMDDVVLPSFKDREVPQAFSSWEWAAAKDRVLQQLWHAGCYGLRPAAYSSVVDDMRARDTLESNSGWPLFTRRKKPEVVKQSIEEAADGRWKTYPAIALFRNYNRKTRLVWMFPMSANLVEGSFFQPLQSRLMQSKYAHNFLAPWTGFEEVRRINTAAYDKGYMLAASDFSSTDAHFGLATSLEVLSVIKYCFVPTSRALLEESIRYMHTIPLVVGLDRQLVGEHGVSSGSNWTNFIETIFDWILGEYVLIKEANRNGELEGIANEELEQLLYFDDEHYQAFYAIGDDMTWFTRIANYDDKFAERLSEYGKQVGQEIKSEKTTNQLDMVKSLQRLFQRGYLRPDGQLRAVYSTVRALKSLVYPEKFHKPELWSKDMEAVRAFMILENCVDHPLFKEFCSFVAAGDPNLITVAKAHPGKQSRLLRLSRLVPGLNTTYNQERRDMALSSFESVKFISKL